MGYRSVFRDDAFAGQVIMVTGGGSGIGRCTAHELASLGAHTVLVGRKQDKLDQVVAEITEDGGSADSQSFDIRIEDDVKAAVAAILDRHSGIDGLVNNAGGQYPAPLSAINQKGWETVVRTNLTGGFLVAREVFNQHMSRNGGSIVNIIADMWDGMPGMGHSGAARAGMLNFTNTAAVEWGHAGVRVNAVAPGWVASSGLDTYDEHFTNEIIPKMRGMVPLSRLGEEAEISSAIVYLMSEAAAYISGACIRIDGGSSLNSKLFPLQTHRNSKRYDGFHRVVRPKAVEKTETD